MSTCIDCGEEMHPFDAADSLTCRACSHLSGNRGKVKVRNLNRKGTDSIGRKHRSTQALGGAAEKSSVEPDE